MPDFLPGNWTVHDRNTCQENWAVGSDHDFPGAPGATHRRYVAQIMMLPDAHLVSAAKELYEALEEFQHAHAAWLESVSTDPDGTEEGSDKIMYRLVEANTKATAARAKARGEKS